MSESGFREALLSGEQKLGCWVFGVNPIFCEQASQLGIDCLLIDMEHGEATLADIPGLLRACAAGSLACQDERLRTAVLVRPASHDAATLSKLADLGVDGVVVPKVDTLAQANAIVAACRYPPRGTRGLAAGSVRGSGYGIDTQYRALADDRLLVAVQIETAAAVDNLDAIASESAIDLLFVGPNDLAGALGYVVQNDVSAEMTDKVLERVGATGKLSGTIPYHGRARKDLQAKGISLLIVGSDVAAHRLYLQALISGV